MPSGPLAMLCRSLGAGYGALRAAAWPGGQQADKGARMVVQLQGAQHVLQQPSGVARQRVAAGRAFGDDQPAGAQRCRCALRVGARKWAVEHGLIVTESTVRTTCQVAFSQVLDLQGVNC